MKNNIFQMHLSHNNNNYFYLAPSMKVKFRNVKITGQGSTSICPTQTYHVGIPLQAANAGPASRGSE
jgi:hypothetical protein